MNVSTLNRDSVRVVLAMMTVLAVSVAGVGAASAVEATDSSALNTDADAGWYLAEAGAVWAVANDDPVGYGIAVASMGVVAAGAASTGAGLVL